MTKSKEYARSSEKLLDDIYYLFKAHRISTSFKFYHLRNDFLSHWTLLDGRKIGNPYWSEEAFNIYRDRYNSWERDREKLLKDIHHDHIVPRLWFEEMIMPIIKANENAEGFEIPKEALKFLFKRFAIGAVVTKEQNLRSIDKMLVLKKKKKIK